MNSISRIKRLFRLSPYLLFAVHLFAWPALEAHAESAKTYYSRGQGAEENGDVIAAYLAYKTAFNLKPGEIKYRATYERIRASATAEYVKEGEKFAQSNNVAAALAAYLKALDIDPGNDIATTKMRMLQKQLHQEDLSEQKFTAPAKTMAPPPTLDPLPVEKYSLHMVEDSRNVYEAIGKAVGLNVLFDPDYNSKRIRSISNTLHHSKHCGLLERSRIPFGSRSRTTRFL
jgi:general secretion pathway protein D